MRGNKNLRRLTTLVTAQTMGNLEKLADMAGYGSTGKVVDKLVRDHMCKLRSLAGGSKVDQFEVEK